MVASTIVQRRTSWNPHRCSIALDGADHRPPRRASTAAVAPQPRAPVPARSADGRGDHRRDARRWRGPRASGCAAVIVVLWRAGLRISEALALSETDLDPERGALLVRRGKGGKRREVGMDRWAWSHLTPWLKLRTSLPVGRLFCVRGVDRPAGGLARPGGDARKQLHRPAVAAGMRRRLTPHQLRHAHAVEMSREGISLIVIQRQLGHYAGDPVKRDRLGGMRARRRGSGMFHSSASGRVSAKWIGTVG